MSVLPFAPPVPSALPPQPAPSAPPQGAQPTPLQAARTSVVVNFPTYRERWADATASVRRLSNADDAVDMLVIAVATDDGKVKHVYHPMPAVVDWHTEPFEPLSWRYRGAL